MNETKRSYATNHLITVNGKQIDLVIISSHYQINHTYLNDEVILEIVKELNNRTFQPEDKKDNPTRKFFMLDNIPYQNKKYKLIWCLWEDNNHLGIINCYRRK